MVGVGGGCSSRGRLVRLYSVSVTGNLKHRVDIYLFRVEVELQNVMSEFVLLGNYRLIDTKYLDLRRFGFQSVESDGFDLMEFHNSNLLFTSSRSCSAGSFAFMKLEVLKTKYSM